MNRTLIAQIAQIGQTNRFYWQQKTVNNITLQGNFDPVRLLSPISEIQEKTKAMLTAFGPGRHIANLGHGILPNIPVDHAKAFVDTVKAFEHSS